MIRCIEKKVIVCSSSMPTNVWSFLFCQCFKCLLWTPMIFNKKHEKKIIHNYLGKIFRDLICICVCAMRTEAQRCRRIDAGNVARMGRDSWASARSSQEQCAQCAPRPSELGQQRPRQSLLSSARTGNTQLTYIYTSGLTLEIADFESSL